MPSTYEIEAGDGEDDRALAAIQGRAVEKANPEVKGLVADTGKVELLGRKFKVADKVGVMPLLKFAAASDLDVTDARALSAMYSMLKDSIDPADWPAFEDWAMESKADADQLFAVITRVLEIVSGRPTPPPSSSSAGRRRTSRTSTASSSGKRGGASRR